MMVRRRWRFRVRKGNGLLEKEVDVGGLEEVRGLIVRGLGGRWGRREVLGRR